MRLPNCRNPARNNSSGGSLDRSARLSWKIGSLREEFLLLSQSRSVQEFSAKTTHILRGSLLAFAAGVFECRDSAWHALFQMHDASAHLTSGPTLESTPTCLVGTFAVSPPRAAVAGPRLDGHPYDENDVLTFELLLDLFYQAHVAFEAAQQKDHLIFGLNHRIAQLNSLVDVAVELASKSCVDELYETAVARMTTLTNSSQGWIEVSTASTTSAFGFPQDTRLPSDLSRALVVEHTTDRSRLRFIIAGKESRTHSELFDDTDCVMMNGIARHVTAALERDSLQREAVAKKLLDQEVAFAASIQRNLIPQRMPLIPGYDVFGINLPSKEIGGDFFDVFELNGRRWCLTIADVAGKGISAALLVNTLHAALRSYTETEDHLDGLVNKLNRLVFRSSTPDKFITFFVAVLEPDTGRIECVNAGHNPPLLRSGVDCIRLGASGPALGILEEFSYPARTVTLQPGATLFLYTDGIPEAENAEEEMFGEEEMSRCLSETTSDLKSDCDRLLQRIHSFTRTHPQSDDITMLWLRRAG